MKRAFTLVELLVTLMVIGVVAAITIPALLGSTDEMQQKVGYKKALSVLGQAVQLLKAKEIQCDVSNSVDLAECFNKVMLGNLVNYNGEPSNYKNVLIAPDGMAYQFLYYREVASGANKDGKNQKTIEKICGNFESLKKYSDGTMANDWEIFAGNTAYCGVIVDVNGLHKGKMKMPEARNTSALLYGQIAEKPGEQGLVDEDPNALGTEQFPIILTSDGVRAIYSRWYPTNENVNKAYSWLYGLSNPVLNNSKKVKR